MENSRRKQLAWLKAIMDHTSWNQSELARRAGITHATLSKFFNDPDNRQELSTSTVGKIAAISPLPHYENARGMFPAGFDAHEAEPFSDSESSVTEAVEALRRGRNGVSAWVLHSRALENIGYLPGDVVVVDETALPRDGDVVRAQIFDTLGNSETAFRVFKRPYLVAASSAREMLAPTLMDDRAEVRGVVIALLRPRPTLLAS